MPIKSLDTSISVNGQSVDYRELLDRDGARLRITIRSDSYRNQCFARISRWNGEEWKMVDTVPPADMKTEDSLAYRSAPPTKFAFSNDRKRLLALAALIL